ncbi:hypothetical protein CFAM422_011901, partial [Trichoderma lentiforme]
DRLVYQKKQRGTSPIADKSWHGWVIVCKEWIPAGAGLRQGKIKPCPCAALPDSCDRRIRGNDGPMERSSADCAVITATTAAVFESVCTSICPAAAPRRCDCDLENVQSPERVQNCMRLASARP